MFDEKVGKLLCTLFCAFQTSHVHSQLDIENQEKIREKPLSTQIRVTLLKLHKKILSILATDGQESHNLC